jgi:hypothetical protein
MVLTALGDDVGLVSDRLDDSALVIRDLWDQVTGAGLRDVSMASIVGAMSAHDALRAALRNLVACDFIGVYSELRRSFEMQMLALAAYHDEAICREWLGGREVSPVALRKIVAAHEPEGGRVVTEKNPILGWTAPWTSLRSSPSVP